MKILLLGSSGFIGRRLTTTLRSMGFSVITASLRDPLLAAEAAKGCGTVINLAGESISQRWSPQIKKAILESRTTAVQQFFSALRALNPAALPQHYISASAVGYYGSSEAATFDEHSEPGTGFLADVCVAWEAQARQALELGLSISIIRTGIVLGAHGGMLAKLLPVFSLGAGGVIGSGHQWYSWIHIEDVIGIYIHAMEQVEGVLNATAPTPARNETFTATLGKVLRRPTLLPVPAFAMNMILGEGAVVALEGQRVLPKRTLESGYTFRYPDLEKALSHAVHDR